MIKSINIPYIEGVHNLAYPEMDQVMELNASKGYISEVNWSDFPYKPSASFRIARSNTHLVIMYDVRGLDLRAVTLEDNGPVWEDSCCEFFVSDTHDGTYYNFELNCIGTLLASKRRSRNDADMFSEEELSRITRHSTLERRQIEENGAIRAWGTAICIPFDLIGLDGNALPESIKANFYKCADMAAHPHYVSWNRIDISQPDFHRPDFFGELKF